MVYSSRQLFAAKGGARTFFTRRVARIVPPYWIVMVITIPLMSLPSDWGSVLGSYLFIPFRAASENIVPVYGVGWTLYFDMYFYALFSAVGFLRRGVAVSPLCFVLWALALLGFWLPPTWAPLQFLFYPIIPGFAFGV